MKEEKSDKIIFYFLWFVVLFLIFVICYVNINCLILNYDEHILFERFGLLFLMMANFCAIGGIMNILPLVLDKKSKE